MNAASLLSKRNLLISAIVVGVLSVSVYAMNIGGFDDYDPPDSIYLTWYDYFRNDLKDSMSVGNVATEWPRWSAEYPYRALFTGRSYGSASSSNLSMQYAFMIYSKKTTTDLFTFEYIDTARKYPDSGRIRAKIRETDYVSSEDIAIRYAVVDSSPYDNVFAQASFWNTLITTGNKDGYGNIVFEFDFYYDCTDKHESNTQLLNISGIRNISVPYDYILTCGGHGSSGGSSGGGSSSSGSGGGSSSGDSSGGSSSGGSSEYPWENDKNTPDYGGSSSGSSSSSMPDYEGTTGEKGDSWDLPEWNAPDLPWTDDDINIPSMPEMDFPEFPTPDFNFPESPTPEFNFPEIPDMPEVELPVVPYDPPDSSWPPPFPGTS